MSFVGTNLLDNPNQLVQIWRKERAYRVGVRLSYAILILSVIALIFDFFWSPTSVILTDFILIGGCIASIIASVKTSEEKYFLWWPCYFGFWISTLPSFWMTGGLNSPFLGIGLAALYVIGVVVQTRIRPAYVVAFVLSHFIFLFIAEIFFDPPFIHLDPIFSIAIMALTLAGIIVCLTHVFSTEDVLASEFTKHYEELGHTKADLQREEAANLAKTTFLANVSHELRTPLAAILGFTDLLSKPDTSLNDKIIYTETVKRNGRQLARLVDDLLDLSRVEVGTAKVEKTICDLHDLINDVITPLSKISVDKGITLTVNYKNSIPEICRTDGVRVKQILTNLINNSIKFTEKGNINLEVELDQTNQLLDFVVIDTGRGLYPEEIERLFRPFSQGDPSLARRYGGTGLGLNLSRRLAKLLGGNLTLVSSTPGAGSSFCFQIPVGDVLEQRWAKEFTHLDHVIEETLNTNIKKGVLENKRILVIDDSVDNITLVELLLEPTGAALDTADNAFDGIKKALSSYYDVIIMDIQMPLMDGYEAVSLLRKKGYNKPIIAFTAHAMAEERQKSLNLGFDGHLTKPIKLESLVEGISSSLRI